VTVDAITAGLATILAAITAGLATLAAAALAVLWPIIQGKRQRHRFNRLMGRELQELKPNGEQWDECKKPDYVHRTVIEDPQAHLDFVLSLDPSIVYNLRRMWWAFGRDGREFLDRLWTLAQDTRNPTIQENAQEWEKTLKDGIPGGYAFHDYGSRVLGHRLRRGWRNGVGQ
jgi:hypothetical protein